MGTATSDNRNSSSHWGSTPSPSQLNTFKQQMQKTGLDVSNYLHHPVFGTLLQGELVRPSKQASLTDRKVPVHIKEFTVTGEQNATLTYQYLVRQEQTENPAFPRVYVHLIQPCGNTSELHNKQFEVKVVFEQLNASLRTIIQERIGKNTYFEETALLQIANITARGLSELQDQSIFHDDISPDSYILSTRDKYKVYHPQVLQSIVTNKSNALAGRKSYISPEALKELLHRNTHGYERSSPGTNTKKSSYNKTTSDLFSLGLTLLEAATLEPENRYYNSNAELDVALLRKKLRKVAHVYSRDFVTLLSKLLAIDPDERSELYDLIRATNRMKEQAQQKAEAQKEKQKQKLPKIWDNEPPNTQTTSSSFKSPQNDWSRQYGAIPPGPFDKSLPESQDRTKSIHRPQTSRGRPPISEIEYSSVRAPNSARSQLYNNPSFAPAEFNRQVNNLPDERSRSRSHPKLSPHKYSSVGNDHYDYNPNLKMDAMQIIDRNNQLARDKDKEKHYYRNSRPSSQTAKPKQREPLLEESADWTPAPKYQNSSETRPKRYDSADIRHPKVELVTRVKEITPGYETGKHPCSSSKPQHETAYHSSIRPSYRTPVRPANEQSLARPPRPSRMTSRGVQVVNHPENVFETVSDSMSLIGSDHPIRNRSQPRVLTYFMDEEEYSTDDVENGVPKYVRVRHYEHSKNGTKKLLSEEERVFDSQFSLDNEETIKEIWKLQRDREKVGHPHPPSKTIATQTPPGPPAGVNQANPSGSFGTIQVQTSPFTTIDGTGFNSKPQSPPENILPAGAKFFLAPPAGLDPQLPPLPLFCLDPPVAPPQPNIQQLAPLPPKPPAAVQQTHQQPNSQPISPRPTVDTLGQEITPRHARSNRMSSMVVPPLPVVVTERAVSSSPSPEPKVTRITKPPIVRRDLSKNIDDPISRSYRAFDVGQIVDRKYSLHPDNGDILEEILRKVESGVRREKKAVVDATGLLLAHASNVDMSAPVQGTGKTLKDCIKRYPQNGFQPATPPGRPRVLETSTIYHGTALDNMKHEPPPFFLESMEQDKFESYQRIETPDGSVSPRFANSNPSSKPTINVKSQQQQLPPVMKSPPAQTNPQPQPKIQPPVMHTNLQLPPQQTLQPPSEPEKKEPLRLRFQKINGKDVPVAIDNHGMSDQEKRKILEMYLKKEGLPTTMIEQLIGPGRPQANTSPAYTETVALPPTPPIVVSPSGQPTPGTNTKIYRPSDDVSAASPSPQTYTAGGMNPKTQTGTSSTINRQPTTFTDNQYQVAPVQQVPHQNGNRHATNPPPLSLADESFDGGKSYFSNMKIYTPDQDLVIPSGQDRRGPSLIDEIQRKPYESNSSLSGGSTVQVTNRGRLQPAQNRQNNPVVQYSQQQGNSSLGFAGQSYTSQPYQSQSRVAGQIQDPGSQSRYLSSSPSQPSQQLNSTKFYDGGKASTQPERPITHQFQEVTQRDRSPSPPSNPALLRSASPPNLQKQSSGKPVQQLAKLPSTKKAQRQFQQQMGSSGILGEIQEDDDFMAAQDDDIFLPPSLNSQSHQKTIEGSKLERDAQARDAFGFESSMPTGEPYGRAAYNPGYSQRDRGYTPPDINFESQFIEPSGREQNNTSKGGLKAFKDNGFGFASNSAGKPQIMVTPPSPRIAQSRQANGNSTIRISTAPQQVKNSTISAANRSPVGFSAFGSVASSMGQGLGEDAFGDFEDDGYGQPQSKDQWQIASYRADRESTF